MRRRWREEMLVSTTLQTTRQSRNNRPIHPTIQNSSITLRLPAVNVNLNLTE